MFVFQKRKIRQKRMKKGIAILFTAIMLLTGIQPVLSLHLCAGTLFSVAIYEEAESDACCEEPMEASCHTTTGKDKAQKGSSSDINVYQEDCCEFQTMEIITDDFTFEHTNTTIQQPVVLSYLPVSAIFNDLIHLILPDTTSKRDHQSPPYGFYRKTLDFLSYICIYRI